MGTTSDAGRRPWYVVELQPDPHPLRGQVVLDALLDLLAGEVGSAAVDAYSDYADELTPRAAAAQDTLRALGETRAGRGDRWMAVELDLADPRHRELLRDYGAWAIDTGVFTDGWLGERIGLHDSSLSVTARLTGAQAEALAPRVASVGRVELLADVHRRRRDERRARRVEARRDRFGRLRRCR